MMFHVDALICHICSVGGLDYGTVRAGAFMGLQMLSNLEDSLLRQSSCGSVTAKANQSSLENGIAHHAIGLCYLLTFNSIHMHALSAHERVLCTRIPML